jgi:heme-degrading monooxygenase HmoA
MIERIWHGWTTPENADEYEQLLKEEIGPQFADSDIDGYHGMRVLRRSQEDEVEFMTVMRFSSLEAVKRFAGEDYTHAHVPDAARDILSRFDDRASHYELRMDGTT